jgi:hypothetical protein
MKELPKGVYDKLEEVWQHDDFGTFKGGLGAVMIVRYSDTPVGRLRNFYDNLRSSPKLSSPYSEVLFEFMLEKDEN